MSPTGDADRLGPTPPGKLICNSKICLFHFHFDDTPETLIRIRFVLLFFFRTSFYDFLSQHVVPPVKKQNINVFIHSI